MKIHISSQMQRIISSSIFFQLYYFAEKTKPEKLTAPVWKRRWWMNTDEEKVKLKAKKKENTSWKMYPHPNDDIIAILYTLQFFISSVRSLLWLLSSFLCFVCVSVCLWNSRYLCTLLNTGTRFYFGLQFYAELYELFDYYYCFVFQLQNVMAHIFPMCSGFFIRFVDGRYCIFLLSQGEYNTVSRIQYVSKWKKNLGKTTAHTHIHLANYF